jgi:quinol monooxygenase YgiN
MAARVEGIPRETERQTLAHDKGCQRYEGYRSKEPDTYILIERWTDREPAQAHLGSDHRARLPEERAECLSGQFTIARLTRLD